MAGDVKFAVAEFVSRTTNGTQDVTHASLGTAVPTAVIIIGGAAADQNTPETIDARQGIGFAVNTGGAGTQNVHRTMSLDNQANTNTRALWGNADVISAGNSGIGTSFIRAAVSAWIAGGVRLNFTATLNPGRRYIAILIFGADVQAATGLLVPNGVNPTVTVNTLAFQPDLVLLKASNNNAASGTASNLYGTQFGVSIRNPLRHRAVSQVENNAVAAGSSPGSAFYDTASLVIQNVATGAIVYTGLCNNFTATGFDLVVTGTANSEQIAYLALNVSGLGVFLQDYPVETATGNKATTGVGFMPQLLLIGASSVTGKNAAHFDDAQAANLSYSVVAETLTSTDQWSQAVRFDPSADPTDTAELCSPHAVVIGTAASINATQADWVSFDADGWTLNYTAVSGTATRFWALAVEVTPTPPPVSDLRIQSGVAKFALGAVGDLSIQSGLSKFAVASAGDLRLSSGVVKFAVRAYPVQRIPKIIPPAFITLSRAPYIKRTRR